MQVGATGKGEGGSGRDRDGRERAPMARLGYVSRGPRIPGYRTPLPSGRNNSRRSVDDRLCVVVFVDVSADVAERVVAEFLAAAPSAEHRRNYVAGLCTTHTHTHTHGWRRGVVVRGVRRMNEVNARRARLVPGWVTVFGRVYRLGM